MAMSVEVPVAKRHTVSVEVPVTQTDIGEAPSISESAIRQVPVVDGVISVACR